ncbi:MAG TPA: hypothetical protein VKY74_24485 [Chloroflexia bacterium]|nr:hypothetical protein [Chloroflexia bacterium]
MRTLFGTRGPERTDGPAWAFLAVAISVLLTGWLGFLLAELGYFSAWLVALLELGVCLVLLRSAAGTWPAVRPTAGAWLRDLGTTLSLGARIARGRVVRVRPDARNLRLETAALVALLILGGVLFARPAEMIRGALDSGVYINAGVALARTHAIVIHDPLMRDLLDINPVTLAPEEEAREFLQPLSLERYSLNRLRMPGFYMLEKKSGMVLPQHYSLYPVWIGLFYDLFGLAGALLVTPLLALLACAAVFFFARQLFSARVALLALALLVLCPLQIWFARYPVSETPTELLAFLFFYAFLRFHAETGRVATLEAVAAGGANATESTDAEAAAAGRNARLFGVLAAAALGEISLVRPDFPFYLLPLPFYLLGWRLSRTWRREHTWFVVTLALLLAQWTVHFFFFSFAYTMDLYHNVVLDVRRAWPSLLPALYLGALGLFALDRLRPRWRPLATTAGVALARRRLPLLGALCAMVGAYFVYRYLWQPRLLFGDDAWAALQQGPLAFARHLEPYIGAPLQAVAQTGKSNQPGLINTNSFILVRLGWYLSPLGILLGAIGLVRALWKRLTPGTLYFFVTLAIVGTLFSSDSFTVPTYPYSLRRFLPVVIPGLLLLGAYALAWAGEKWRPRRLVRPLAWATAGALGVFFLATGWVLISHTEEAGAVGQIAALAARFPNPAKTVLLFSNERDEPYVVATPLQYIFGFNAFSLNEPYGQTQGRVVQGVVQRWQKQGYTVYALLGANGGKLFMPDLALVPHTQGGAPEWVYNVPELEQLTAQKPKNISMSTLPWGLYDIVSRTQTTVPELPFHLDIGGRDYEYLVAGFSGKEKTHPSDPDAAAWRWTYHDAFLRLPWPASATAQGARLTLRLSAGPPERRVPAPKHPTAAESARLVPAPSGALMLPAPAQVSILASSGPPLGQVTLAPGAPFQDVTIPVPSSVPPDPANPHYLLLHLVSTTWSPAAAEVSADIRALGVEVDSVALDPAP